MLPAHAMFARDVKRRFVDRIVERRSVWAVAGTDGLARVDSPAWKGRQTTLLWSRAEDAQRWGPSLTKGAIVRQLTLGDVLVDVLPALQRLDRRVGTDWSAEPVEPEIEAGLLARTIRQRMLTAFIERCRETGSVYILDAGAGPALRTSAMGAGRFALPCWSTEEEADSFREGPWEDALRITIPTHSFVERTLVWLADSGMRVAPAFAPGPGTLELDPLDLRARFSIDPAREVA